MTPMLAFMNFDDAVVTMETRFLELRTCFVWIRLVLDVFTHFVIEIFVTQLLSSV